MYKHVMGMAENATCSMDGCDMRCAQRKCDMLDGSSMDGCDHEMGMAENATCSMDGYNLG